MNETSGFIKARIRTQEQIEKVYPSAKYWGKPLAEGQLFPSADGVILPYLGKTVWLKKKRRSLGEFYYEIKGTGGFVVTPDWIDYFDSGDLVSPAEWQDPYGEIEDDTWLDPYEERFTILDDMLIVTG